MTKRLLVVTNLYPPQELGGYGRCIADFVFGLSRLGYFVQVVCADAPYLACSSKSGFGLYGESIQRVLTLNGSFENGVSYITDYKHLLSIEKSNKDHLHRLLSCSFDAILVGNIDLIGTSILSYLTSFSLPVLHHIGFIQPPFPVEDMPLASNYHILSASFAVRDSLINSRFPVHSFPVIYPGARCELFSSNNYNASPMLQSAIQLYNNGFALGTPVNPLKIGFAGLLMGSKGPHTIVQALIILKRLGICFQVMFAGVEFQHSYLYQLTSLLDSSGLYGTYQFVGQLDRFQLARFWSLQHIGIFPSVYPEAFGIVGAEIMASGLALFTTGVGGSSELIENGSSGLLFPPDNPEFLAKLLFEQTVSPDNLISLATNAKIRVNSLFDVSISVRKLNNYIEHLIGCT